MKNKTVLAITLIAVGFILECFTLTMESEFLNSKLWLIGLTCMSLGVLGLLWANIIPLLERRSEVLGKFKRKDILKQKKQKKF